VSSLGDSLKFVVCVLAFPARFVVCVLVFRARFVVCVLAFRARFAFIVVAITGNVCTTESLRGAGMDQGGMNTSSGAFPSSVSAGLKSLFPAAAIF
jgi:hypothetical protein